MMKIIKKNQLTILVLALMLVTAGYLNYNSNQTVTTEGKIASIGDATLVSSNVVETKENNTVQNNTTENNIAETNTTNNAVIENKMNNTVTTNTEATESSKDYYTSSRLERENMYS